MKKSAEVTTDSTGSQSATSPAPQVSADVDPARTIFPDAKAALVDVLDRAAVLPEPSKGIDDVIAGNAEGDSNPFGGAPITTANAETFDPAIHEADSFGNPVLNADKSFRRKRGRKAGVNYNAPRSTGSGAAQAEHVDAELLKRKTAAAVCTQVLITGGVGFFGDEWLPVKDKAAGRDDQQQLQSAFENYFEAVGTIDLPPGIALLAAVGAYALPRFHLPQTQERAKGLFQWSKEKIVKLLPGRKATPALKMAA